MQNIDYCSLLIRFNRNILYTLLDFSCTETIFLSIALINKDFHMKTRDYIQISQTLQIKDTNFLFAPIFPKVENMTLHCMPHLGSISIYFPESLQNLKIYYAPITSVNFPNTPRNLRSFKSYYTVFPDLYLPSLASGSLKILKINLCESKSREYEHLIQWDHLEELYISCYNINEPLASAIINHNGLKNYTLLILVFTIGKFYFQISYLWRDFIISQVSNSLSS